MKNSVKVEMVKLTNEQMDKLKKLNGLDPFDKDPDNVLWGILSCNIKGKYWLVETDDSGLKYGLKYVY